MNLEKIMKMLDWNEPVSTQEQGIILAQKEIDFQPFFQPREERGYFRKGVWDNCAIVIAMKEDRLLIPYETRLLEWIKDINWPGARIIFERLIRYKGENFQDQIEAAYRKAKQESDKSLMVSLKELILKREMQVRDRAAEGIKRVCLIKTFPRYRTIGKAYRANIHYQTVV